MKRAKKRLDLSRETIHTLRVICEGDLERIAGGMDGSDRDMTCAICRESMPTVCPGPT